MRDEMQLGDHAFFYHSSCAEPGVAGIVEVSRLAYPDASQFDPKSPYFDPKSARDAPRWLNVDVKLVRKTNLVPLAQLRETPGLEDMITLRRGNRLRNQSARRHCRNAPPLLWFPSIRPGWRGAASQYQHRGRSQRNRQLQRSH